MYVLINIADLFNPMVFKSKQQIINLLNTNRVTLDKYIKEKAILNNHIIVRCEVIKNDNKGNKNNLVYQLLYIAFIGQ